ncbi:MAG: hypothetical protein ABIH37_02690 [archaeon]
MAITWGYNITDLLNTWADLGIFAYVLPFLMIFAMVFGILTKSEILGKNKGVHATIALAVGLLSLQFDYVSGFYASIFPYAGMGMAVLLVGLILMGLLSPDGSKAASWIWFGLGALIFLFVMAGALSDTYFLGGFTVAEALPALFAILILIGFMSLIIWGGGKSGYPAAGGGGAHH